MAWHRHLTAEKNAALGALGIQYLLRLSHFAPLTHPCMIGAVTHFWNKTTNNFHLPCKIFGMSLLDVAAITGLPISSPEFTSDMQPERQYKIGSMTSYSEFIAHHMGADNEPVTDDEHVAFLFYWLNAIVFCSRNVQMQKIFYPLAALLHEGNNFNLAKLLLGHISKELGQFVNCLRKNFLISTGGPLWLLQLWLNAIFEKFMITLGDRTSDKQHIEGFQLATFKPHFPETQSDEDQFWVVFSLFHSCKNFNNDDLNFTPLLCRNCGPAWLERLLFPNYNQEDEITNRTWTNLLAVQVIPIGLPQYKKEHFKATLYAPHYASRQLGFSQAIPFPLPKNNKPLCHINLVSKEALDVYLSSNQQQKMGYHHLVYERSSFITKSCFDWWTAYFSKYNCIFEEIRNSATRIASIAEGSPKKSLKRKAKTTSFSRQPQRKSQRTPSRTSRRVQSSSKSSSEDNEPLIQNLPAASLDSDDDDEADPASQLIRRRRQIILAETTAQSTSSSLAPVKKAWRKVEPPNLEANVGATHHKAYKGYTSNKSNLSYRAPNEVIQEALESRNQELSKHIWHCMVDTKIEGENCPAMCINEHEEQHSPSQTANIDHPLSSVQAGAFTGSHVAPDSDSASQIPESNSDSPSRVPETTAPESDSPTQIPETISSPQKSLNPPRDAGISTSHDLDPPSETLGMIPQPTDTDLIGLVNILNQVVQEDKVPISTPTPAGPSTSGLPLELN
ncbi:uncharacterized protein DS421_18g613910 [Arachis hypogaea]|nr:uncharacterized protein DS421_18g613910 [Arachis hypogaea]